MLVFRVSDVRPLLSPNMEEHLLFSVCDGLIKIFTPALHI
jgi:hypothetical protein